MHSFIIWVSDQITSLCNILNTPFPVELSEVISKIPLECRSLIIVSYSFSTSGFFLNRCRWLHSLSMLLILLPRRGRVLAEELHKPIIRKFGKRKMYIYFFVDNIWGGDLAECN